MSESSFDFPVTVGIHDSAGSFSDRWLEFCEREGIRFRRVNCLATDVIEQCKDLDAILWHWSHDDAANKLVARQVITSLEAMGIHVFPNTSTCWHYDDKVAQKYLLESIGAPLIPTWVFTSQADALRWIESAVWPKVFKLRCGAGSANVRLVRSRREAVALCRQAFSHGFFAVSGYTTDLGTRLRKTKDARQFWKKLANAPRNLWRVLAMRRELPKERGYIYFQEFLPDNTEDTRITIVGDRAFGFQRANRPGDFRASGSGQISYRADRIDKRCVDVAFQVAKRLKTQSLAFDFLFDRDARPMIGEISYCYMAAAVHACEGHWDPAGKWQAGQVWPQEAILRDLLTAHETRRRNH
jgi:glutathione synthase/RimK-type ligase-like ATP-grasp enzyme